MISNFLRFDSMITPTIIKVVFWIGTGLSVLSGLGLVISGMNAIIGGGAQVFSGLVTIIVGPLFVRIYCELLIIFFKMHESLIEIKNTLAKQESLSHEE